MEDLGQWNSKIMEALEKNLDVLIKKNKDGTIKILAYKPRNLKKKI